MVKSLIAILCLIFLSSCGTGAEKKIIQGIVTKTVAERKVKLPDQPDFCYEPILGVRVKIGEKWRWINYRYEVIIENANKDKAACGEWYKSLQKSFEKGT